MNEFCGEFGEVRRATRGRMLARLAGGAVAALGGGVLIALRPEAATPAPSVSTDRKIFDFALQLEYLQAAFYSAAVDGGALRGELLDFAETVGGHEREHVAFLEQALGPAASPKPRFDFGRATSSEREFLDAAVLLENIGVSAYNGQAANLTKPALGAAAKIVSVEGRHAAWVSALAGREPAPRAADPGQTAAAVTAMLKRTGFVQ